MVRIAIESFMDELTLKSNRTRRLPPGAARKDTALRAAIDLAAENAGWRTALLARSGRGVALQGNPRDETAESRALLFLAQAAHGGVSTARGLRRDIGRDTPNGGLEMKSVCLLRAPLRYRVVVQAECISRP